MGLRDGFLKLRDALANAWAESAGQRVEVVGFSAISGFVVTQTVTDFAPSQPKADPAEEVISFEAEDAEEGTVDEDEPAFDPEAVERGVWQAADPDRLPPKTPSVRIEDRVVNGEQGKVLFIKPDHDKLHGEAPYIPAEYAEDVAAINSPKPVQYKDYPHEPAPEFGI